MRESTIENKVNKYAESKGWLQYKFQSANNRGVPDRIYIRNGAVFFIEFKATGKKPTGLQKDTHDELRSQYVQVFVCDNVEHGYEIINSMG